MKRKYPMARYTLTTEDLAKVLGYCEHWVRTKARAGELPAIKQFHKWRFCLEEVEEVYLKNTEIALESYTYDEDETEECDLLQ